MSMMNSEPSQGTITQTVNDTERKENNGRKKKKKPKSRYHVEGREVTRRKQNERSRKNASPT